jgi:hypothetical protein
MKTTHMKKNGLGLAALTLVFALGLAGCGEFAAKTLAKQTSDAAKKMTALQEKAADIEEKAAGLSARERRIYQRELTRLGIGDAPEWLFNDEAALLSGAPEAAEGEDDDDTGGSGGGSLAGIFGGGRGGGSKLTITGLPSGTYYQVAVGRDVSNSNANFVAGSSPGLDGLGNNVFTLFDVKAGEQTNSLKYWTGSGNWEVLLAGGANPNSPKSVAGWRATVKFSNGSATVPFSKFTQITK